MKKGLKKMPCFCLRPYTDMELVHFICGHVVHAECASQHMVYRLNEGSLMACPICNTGGEAQGQIFLNIEEEDAEKVLIQNPHLFESLRSHHQALLQGQGQMQAPMLQNPVPENENNDNQNNHDDFYHDFNGDDDDMDDDDGDHDGDADDESESSMDASDHYIEREMDHCNIPRLGVRVQVNEEGVLLVPIPTEIMSDSDDDDNYVEDFTIPSLALGLRVHSDTMTFSTRPWTRLQGQMNGQPGNNEPNDQNNRDDDDSMDEGDDEGDAPEIYVEQMGYCDIARLGIRLQTNNQGVQLSPIPTEIMSDSDDEEVLNFTVPTLVLGLRVDSHTMTFSNIQN